MVNYQGRIERAAKICMSKRLQSESAEERQVQQKVKHAIIVTGGKQYRVAEGDVLFIEKLDAEAGDTVTFDQVLAVVDGEIAKRQKVAQYYREALADVPGIRVLQDLPGVKHNYAYFPIEVDAKEYGMTRDELYDKLKANDIYSRRYFYPLCSDFPTYRGLPSASAENLPVATRVAQRILCLPMFAGLEESAQRKIITLIQKAN